MASLIISAAGKTWEFHKIRVTFLGPYSKDYRILGSILGSPILRMYHFADAVLVVGDFVQPHVGASTNTKT